MGEMIAFLFLILPKIRIGDSGIMIGEIAITVYLTLYFLRRHLALSLSRSAKILAFFIFYLVFLSSIINMVRYATLPYYSIIYYFRTLSYLGFYIIGYRLDACRLKEVIVYPLLINFAFMLMTMIIYFFIRHPSAQDYLWGYDFGLRMQPIFGAAFDLSNKPFYLQYIGGGSGNLLCAWALFVFIFLQESNQNNLAYTLIIAITVFLSFSRVGFLTFLLAYLYYTLRLLKFKSKLWMVVLMLFALVSYNIILGSTTTVLTRLTNTIGDNGLDASAIGRIRNYDAIGYALSQDISGLFVGFGFEPRFLMKKTNSGFAESFWLQILVSSGTVGLIFYGLFGLSIFKKRKKPLYVILWKYFLFQNIMSWTVGGGDFLSSNNLFMMFLLLGAARKTEYSSKPRYLQGSIDEERVSN